MEGPLLNMQPGRPATNNDVPRVVKAPLGQTDPNTLPYPYPYP